MKKAFALVAAGMAISLAVPALAAPKAGFTKAEISKKSLPKGLLKAFEKANEHGLKGLEKALENQYKSRGC